VNTCLGHGDDIHEEKAAKQYPALEASRDGTNR